MARKTNIPSQETINRLYVDLYNKIKAARDGAEEHNKKLIVLLGEEHASYNSHFLIRMIAFIGLRLGINDIGLEDNQEGIRKASIIEQQLVINQRVSQPKNFLELYGRTEFYDLLPTPECTFVEDREKYALLNAELDKDLFRCLKINLHPIDPHHYLPSELTLNDINRIRSEDSVDTAISDAIRALADQRHCICSVGLNHLAPVLEKLGNTCSVLPINCCAGITLKHVADDPATDADIRELLLKRHDKVKKIYAPAIATEPPIPIGLGIRMIMEAETRHQQKLGEISELEAQTRLSALSNSRVKTHYPLI